MRRHRMQRATDGDGGAPKAPRAGGAPKATRGRAATKATRASTGTRKAAGTTGRKIAAVTRRKATTAAKPATSRGSRCPQGAGQGHRHAEHDHQGRHPRRAARRRAEARQVHHRAARDDTARQGGTGRSRMG
jgi:hypothetical protein